MNGAGQDVIYVAELSPGLFDADVIRLAANENRLLLTEDKDFGEMVFRRRKLAPGPVFLRIDPISISSSG